MTDDTLNDIAWPVNIESMSAPRQKSIFQNDDQKKKKRKKCRRCCGLLCCPCSLFCIALWLFCALLLLAVLLATLLLLLAGGKTTKPIGLIILDTNTTTENTTITSTRQVNTTITSTTTTITTSSTAAVPSADKIRHLSCDRGTTTTPIICGESCLNQSWIDRSGDLALWTFDETFTDSTGTYNGYGSSNLPNFTVGYFGQAALFNASAQQAIYAPFIPLNNASFTVEVWIKPTGYPNSRDHSIVGLCPSKVTNQCLHINIRYRKLYFGFYRNDVPGITILPLNQWMHTAFVFDAITKVQTIYLNGFQDAQTTTSNVLSVNAGNFTIGINEGVNFPYSYFQGYMDQLSINQRPKSSCEILERATLAAHFKFDTTSPYNDSGPNRVATTSSSTSIITGYKNQAISLNGLSSSYFQTLGFTSLGTSNQAFSITMWIKPQILSGTLVHLSTSSSGTGSACFPLLGFASNGAIIAQVLTSSNTIVTATGPILQVSSSWSFIVQTWSSTNGLQLYINNTLVTSVSASTFLGSETTPNYLTLGNCLNGCSACVSGSVGAAGPFSGAIDDWRIYNREITSNDVCALYTTT